MISRRSRLGERHKQIYRSGRSCRAGRLGMLTTIASNEFDFSRNEIPVNALSPSRSHRA